MTTMITFNELRQIKDMLPSGSMQKIADELGLDVETVRNYFGGDHYDEGKAVGLHIEQCPNGGIVKLDDTTILEKAKEIGFRVLQFNAVVKSNTTALKLYQKLGFTQLGTIPGGFLNKDGVYEDIIVHYKEL